MAIAFNVVTQRTVENQSMLALLQGSIKAKLQLAFLDKTQKVDRKDIIRVQMYSNDQPMVKDMLLQVSSKGISDINQDIDIALMAKIGCNMDLKFISENSSLNIQFK